MRKEEKEYSKILLINVFGVTIIILLIWLLLGIKTPKKPTPSPTPPGPQPMTNISWSTPDTFTYDGSLHTISVSGYPTGSTVTYTGGEDGTNGATAIGSYTISATIDNPNYQTWTGTHTLDITTPPSYIRLTDSTEYTIDISYNDFLTNRTYNGTFDFRDTNGVDQTITRTDIKEIHLFLPQITDAPDNYLANMCYDMSNLTDVDIQIPNTITTVGNSFCSGMIYNCTSLISLPSNFNIPTGITSIGSDFCTWMFYGCTSLNSLPSGFNLPQGITTSPPNFCRGMFQSCSSLTSLPSNFNLPQLISVWAGNFFCTSMFGWCSSLISLPQGFNIPQGIPSVGDSFCTNMFENCTSLRNDSANLVTITLLNPTSAGRSIYRNMFYNCTALTGVAASPNPGDSISINAN